MLSVVLALSATGCAGVVPQHQSETYSMVQLGKEQWLFGPRGLERVVYDFNQDGRADAIVYYAGGRPEDPRRIRLRSQRQHQPLGVLPTRWFDPEGGYVEARSAGPDEWTHADAGGRLTLRELDQDGDSRPDRWEHFSGGSLTSVEVDRNGDGKPDAN